MRNKTRTELSMSSYYIFFNLSAVIIGQPFPNNPSNNRIQASKKSANFYAIPSTLSQSEPEKSILGLRAVCWFMYELMLIC